MPLRVLLVVAMALGTGFGSALVLASAGGGEAPWSMIAVEPVGPCASAPGVAVDASGRTLAIWGACVNGTDLAAGYVNVLATRPPGGPFRRATELPGALTSMTAEGDGTSLVALSDETQHGLVALDVTAGGRMIRTATLSRRFLYDRHVASNARGTTLVAWVTNRLPQRLQVRVRSGRASAFGPPVTLAMFAREGDVGGVSVAVGPRGELAVLWASARNGRRYVLARIRRAGARAFGPALRVGTNDRIAAIASAFTTMGGVVAIWSTADGGEQQDRPAVVRVASLRRDGRRFARERVLGIGVPRERQSTGEAVGATGTGDGAMVAWTSAHYQLRAAAVTSAGSVAQPRTLDSHGLLGGLVTSHSGALLVTWQHHPDPVGPDTRVEAALRPPGGPFGDAEAVGPPMSQPGGAALDPSGAHAVVGWVTVRVAEPQVGISERPIR